MVGMSAYRHGGLSLNEIDNLEPVVSVQSPDGLDVKHMSLQVTSDTGNDERRAITGNVREAREEESSIEGAT